MSLPYPYGILLVRSIYIVCSVWDMRVVALIFVVFGEIKFILKMNRGLLWSEDLVLSTSVVCSYTEKWHSW